MWAWHSNGNYEIISDLFIYWSWLWSERTLSLTHLVWPHRSVREPTREAQDSADQSMKKPILVSLILLNEPLKALMLVASTARWSSWFHLLITRLEKKYLQQSRVHLNLTSFLECPLVPMLLSAKVKNVFSLSRDIPLHIYVTKFVGLEDVGVMHETIKSFVHCVIK